MHKHFLIPLLALTALTAAPAPTQIPAGTPSKAVLYFRFGAEGPEQHEMVVAYSNATKANAKLTLEVFSPGGTLVDVPYSAQDGGVTRLQRLVQDCGPLASGVFTTSSKGLPLLRGWMRITSEPAGAVTVLVHGRVAVGTGPSELKFTLHPQTGRTAQIMGPFDNGTTDHFLVANNSNLPDRLTLIAWSRQGGEMCRALLPVGPGHYYKQHLRNYLPCTEGKTATLEVRSETGATAAMVFIYPATGAAIPVEAQAGELTLAEKFRDFVDELKRRLRW